MPYTRAIPRGIARSILATSLAALSGGCAPAEEAPTQLVVSAASSLADVVVQLADSYHVLHPDVAIATNFASSGTLVQQVRQGAGVDIFLSASEREMGLLAAEGLIEVGSERDLASNELVMVVPRGDGQAAALNDLATRGVERVALGAPGSVPAGAYAREMLERLGMWEQIEPKAVFSSNVRQALAYVARGDVDAALVYRTDALRSPEVTIVAAAPAGSHAPIRYLGAVIQGSPRMAEAAAFLEYIAGDSGVAAFRDHGFLPVPASVGVR